MIFIAKWKKVLKPNIGKLGYYVGNGVDSTKNIHKAAIWFSKKQAQSNLKDVFNMYRESTIEYFDFIECELKIKKL